MNFLPQNNIPDRVLKAEETLRMIARASAPDGLVSRVQANLDSAPRVSVLLSWRTGFSGWMYSPALRGFAAATIVCVVAGGGWSIYSHVQPAPTAKVIEAPARVGGGGAFSNAGAMRKPDTLNGPVLAQPVVPDKQNTVAAPALNGKTQSGVPKAKPPTHKKAANPSANAGQDSRAK
jgi:hypothetical protein